MLDIKINVYPVKVEDSDEIAYLGRFAITGEGIADHEGLIGNMEPKGAMLAAIIEASSWLNKNVAVKMPPFDVNSIGCIKKGALYGADTQKRTSDTDLHDDTTRN
jgi:hypothetical protein